MLTVVRRLLQRLGAAVERQGKLSHSVLGVILMLMMLGEWTTDAIGIHAVFGGFLLGAAMPRGLLARGGHRDGERPDEKQGQRESRSDHEDYHLQPEKIGS